jgi:thymidylate synthase (FAD)
MKVKIKWITPEAEKTVMWCARVSNPKNQDSDDTRLISYLIRHKHWSPFEMASMCVEIHTTRDISRQILRHRSFTFQEFSTRYAEIDDEPVYREARLQDPKNRQNSLPVVDQDLSDYFSESQRLVWEACYAAYKDAIKLGIAREQARALLPEGLTPTTLLMCGNLRSWIHYCQLRGANGTQKEHADVAAEIAGILTEHCPSIAKFL